MAIIHLVSLIEHYGYLGLFVMLMLEYFILVVPGETALTTTGVLSRSGVLHLNIGWLIVVTALGTFAGSTIAYGIGRVCGRPLLVRYGKYVGLTEKRLASSERMFQKQPWLILIIAKYIAVVRDIVPYLAGINRTPLRVFIPLNLLASGLWTATFLALGGVIGGLWKFVDHHWQITVIPAAIVVVGCGYGYWLLKKRLHAALDHERSVEG
ncbi:DedA family protein [Alicyclobacillus hesperidum]|uniref:DedA family protein n=1 Tax=Alicyclobacillus hesperidum TaxID=89784 RepID=UPI00249114D8|nr:DedA family protein [Alicyclobacillus hesperidum]